MKPVSALTLCAGIALSALTLPQPALAHGDVSCSVPRSERQPSVRLQRQLIQAGWKVGKIKVYNGCYEVYGRDEQGNDVEAFFDPRTLTRIDV